MHLQHFFCTLKKDFYTLIYQSGWESLRRSKFHLLRHQPPTPPTILCSRLRFVSCPVLSFLLSFSSVCGPWSLRFSVLHSFVHCRWWSLWFVSLLFSFEECFLKNQNLWETDYKIRFIHCETDSVIRFIKKRITESVS